MPSGERLPSEEFLNQLWPGLAPWNDRKTVVLIGVVSALVGAAALAYAVLTYQRGGGAVSPWKTAMGWLLLAAPGAAIAGGVLCLFPVTRRHGRRLLVAGLGVGLGFIGPILVLLLAMRLADM
jgi:hypothetical protein